MTLNEGDFLRDYDRGDFARTGQGRLRLSPRVVAALEEIEALRQRIGRLEGELRVYSNADIDALVTLSGRPAGSTTLGTFTGDTITDDVTVKAALQEIEDALEGHIPVLVEVHNQTGSQIDKGDAVYVSGEHPSSGKPLVSLADSNGAATYPSIGLVHEDIPTGQDGFVVLSGFLDNLDTNTRGWTAGEALYLSSTPGVLTNSRPSASSEQVQKVALVSRDHATAGSVIVIGAGRVNDIPNELTDLTGVARNATDLGTFTGTTIPDSRDIKEALQDLETAVEGKAATGHTHTLADVTDSGALAPLDTVDTAQIDDDAVTYGKLQNAVSNNVLLGNNNGAGTAFEELSATDARTLLNVEDGATADQTAADIRGLGFFDTTNDGAGSGLDSDTVDGYEASQLLARGNHTGTQGAWTITGLGSLATKSTVAEGDLATGAVSSTKLATDAVETVKIKDSNVTYAKIQDVTADRMLGRLSTTGVVTELSNADIRTFLNVEDGATADQTDEEVYDAWINHGVTTAGFPASPSVNDICYRPDGLVDAGWYVYDGTYWLGEVRSVKWWYSGTLNASGYLRAMQNVSATAQVGYPLINRWRVVGWSAAWQTNSQPVGNLEFRVDGVSAGTSSTDPGSSKNQNHVTGLSIDMLGSSGKTFGLYWSRTSGQWVHPWIEVFMRRAI